MSTRISGSGWWLHILGAVAIMAAGWWLGYPLVALIINTVLWPVREWWQKFNTPNYFWNLWGALGAIFTLHVLAEWVPAVAVGFIIYGMQ